MRLALEILKTIFIVFSVPFLHGCAANWKSINHEFDYGSSERPEAMGTKVISIDAKQRLAISDAVGRFCSEPSPDAMSALASTFGLNISNPTDISGNTSGSSAESAASIGLRTQSIQLMRDAMYRICELERNDALDKSTAFLLHSGYQDVMIALLSIEQLTGVVRAPAVTLNTATTGSVSQNIKDLTELEESIQASLETKIKDQTKVEVAIAQLEKEKASAEKTKSDMAQESDPQDEQSFEAINQIIADKTTALEKEQVKLGLVNDEITSIKAQLELVKDTKSVHQTIATSASGGGTIQQESDASKLSKEATERVAESVEKIAIAALERERVLPACILFITGETERLARQRAEINAQRLAQTSKDKSADQENVLAKIEQTLQKTESSVKEASDLCREYMRSRPQSTKE
ncbi:hypothetical protein [Marinagarivorans cellulosilyticus]|uniref:Uncharacterized protein n=1 Tax=Marinagarivorans cellulosilyticus TaxID=2721545 RepID=A0AAN1WEU9_9GAMM|nr:hypothetical protein [Marinagarivorans cellulosilyticus]BCD96291.1 hypothetical protein MARGE09_P0491 [Marinagarivorans cellulosilyticus]